MEPEKFVVVQLQKGIQCHMFKLPIPVAKQLAEDILKQIEQMEQTEKGDKK